MEKRFKNLTKISPEEADNFLSADEDFKNNFIAFYTITPSDDGWDVINYFTKRPRKKAPQFGEGKQSVYILSNPAMPGLLKIGYTAKEIGQRMDQLYKGSGVPSPFKLEYLYKCNNGMNIEEEVHKYLKEFRHNNYREFFEIGLKQAIDAVNKIGKNNL